MHLHFKNVLLKLRKVLCVLNKFFYIVLLLVILLLNEKAKTLLFHF